MRIAQVTPLFESDQRITAEQMVDDYVEVYDRLITRNQMKLVEVRA